jgi:hypothetical protein
MSNPIIAAISPPRETAPSGTDKRTRCAYAICRRILRGACACEYARIDPPCPERMLAALDAESIFAGEG